MSILDGVGGNLKTSRLFHTLIPSFIHVDHVMQVEMQSLCKLWIPYSYFFGMPRFQHM